MLYLSENTIKKLTLQFLKGYYKYRPRSGDAKGYLDLVSGVGIVSDGQIVFPLENGKKFTASFEATSSNVKEEVFYQKQKRLLWYDSLAFSGILTSFALSLSYRSEWLTLQELGYFFTLCKYGAIFAIFGFVYHRIAGSFARYRYIHAIEQFKQFYANEQWIAIAEDVFIGDTEQETTKFQKFYKELRNQCVNFGFGLIEIKVDRTAHVVITPAREEVFKSKRRRLPFLEKINLPSIPSDSRYAHLWDSFYTSTKNMTSEATSIFRFQKNFWKQWSIMSCCFVFICFVFFKEYQRQPVRFVNSDDFFNNQELKINQAPSLEPEDYEIDTSHNITTPKKQEPYLHLTENQTETSTSDNSNEVYINSEGRQISYGCARFSNLQGEYYMILDSDYTDLENAMNRLEVLQNAGIEANCIWSGCFNNIVPCYLVYLDLLHTEREKAENTLNGIAEKLKKYDLYRGGVMVLPINTSKN